MLCRSLAQEWAADGIRVNAVAPGMVRTPLTERIYLHGEVKARREALVPLGADRDAGGHRGGGGVPRRAGGGVRHRAGDPGGRRHRGQRARGSSRGCRRHERRGSCDVLVVGSGAGGLATAVVAALPRARRAGGREGAGARRDDRLVRRLALDPAQPARGAGGHRRGRGRAAALSRERARQRGGRSAARRVPAQRAGDGALLRGGDRGRLRRRQPACRISTRRPGTPTGGRSVAAAPYDGRALGPWIAKLRPPLDIVSVARHGHRLGGGPQPFRQRDAVARVGAACGGAVPAARPGSRRCTGGGCSSSTAMRWSRGCSGARSTAAWRSGPRRRRRGWSSRTAAWSGRGVGGAAPRSVRARRGVVLATGGFPHDAARIAAMFEHPRHHSAAPEGNTGDGMRMGEAVGGAVADDLVHPGAWAPVSLVPRADGSVGRFPHLVERAKPGFIAVDARGRRFVNEADSYHDFMAALMRGHAGGRGAGGLADRRPRGAAALGARVGEAVPVPARGDTCGSGYLKRGRTLGRAGAWPAGSSRRRSRRRWRGSTTSARRGEDPEFGRGASAYNRVQGDAAATRAEPGARAAREGAVLRGPDRGGEPRDLRGAADRRRGAGAGRATGRRSRGSSRSGNDMSSIMGGNYPERRDHPRAGDDLRIRRGPGARGAARGRAATRQRGLEETAMRFYEIATLKTVIFGTGKAAPAVEAWVKAPEGRGGCSGRSPRTSGR